MKRPWVFAIPVSLFASLSFSLGDHCPEESISSGSPEHVLAGLDLVSGTFEQVRAAYGARPSSMRTATLITRPEVVTRRTTGNWASTSWR